MPSSNRGLGVGILDCRECVAGEGGEMTDAYCSLLSCLWMEGERGQEGVRNLTSQVGESDRIHLSRGPRKRGKNSHCQDKDMDCEDGE